MTFGWVPAGQIPELTEVLRRIGRGVSPREYRVIDIVCPQQHRLLTVYRTTIGLVACGLAMPEARDKEAGAATRGSAKGVVQADAMVLNGPHHATAMVQCTRCGIVGDVPIRWVLERIADRTPRAVWTDDQPDAML